MERLLGQVDHDVFADRTQPWRSRVEALALELRQRLTAHPGAVPLMGILRVLALIPILSGLIWFAAVVFGLGALTVTIWRARSTAQAQHWAAVPALFLGAGGVVLLAFGSRPLNGRQGLSAERLEKSPGVEAPAGRIGSTRGGGHEAHDVAPA